MTPEEYFGTLQASFTEVWKSHLLTDKYDDHKALEDYYEDILDAVDDLIEHWIGSNGKLDDLKNTMSVDIDDPEDYLEDLKEFVKRGREELFDKDDTELWSDTDDILGIIDSTLYKIDHLDESCKSLSDYIRESLS